MHGTVIYWVDLLGKYQQELLVFTDCKSRLIGDDGIYITVANCGGVEKETPLKIEK